MLRDISTLISFGINLLMIITYHMQIDPNDSLLEINETSRYGIPTPMIM
jgi:hypothetical protein